MRRERDGTRASKSNERDSVPLEEVPSTVRQTSKIQARLVIVTYSLGSSML